MMGWVTPAKPKQIDPEGHRIIGLSVEGNHPVFAPQAHSLCLASSGAGKTTNVAVPALLDLAASQPEKAILVFDGKQGEIAAQTAQMYADLGRPVRIIDDMNTRPELAHLKVSANPYGAVTATHRRDPRDVIFASETMAHTMIEEPSNDARNEYWRAWARLLLEFANFVMLRRKPENATPGATAAIISDPDMLIGFAEIEAEEGDPFQQTLARAILAMRHHEHFGQHLEAASRAARTFMPGSRMADVGTESDHTHESMIREGAIIYLCGPQSRMSRLATYYALHVQGFCDALFSGAGALRAVCDEFTNMPLKSLIDALTVLRSYGGEFHMIAQSRSEILRKYGRHETATLEDNAVVKTYLGFASFEEAERISKAIGDEHAVATALGGDSDGLKLNTNLSLIKQRQMSTADLMSMPKDRMLAHIKGVGFIQLRPLGQHERAPYATLLADNPLEGGRLRSDPKITLTMPEVTP